MTFDRHHVAAKLNEAIGEVRRAEQPGPERRRRVTRRVR
jgi:hypothetical protein